MDSDLVIISVALAVLLSAAVWADVQQRRIPNLLVFPFWLLALIIHLMLGGSEGAFASLLGLMLAFGLALPFWLLGWMGAGDVKLIGAVGGLTGYALVPSTIVAIALSGLCLALAAMAAYGSLFRALDRYRASLAISLTVRKSTFLQPSSEDEKIQLPYAIAIAAGTSFVWINNMLETAGVLTM